MTTTMKNKLFLAFVIVVAICNAYNIYCFWFEAGAFEIFFAKLMASVFLVSISISLYQDWLMRKIREFRGE